MRKLLQNFLVVTLFGLFAHSAFAAPKSVLIPEWQASNENNMAVIDHSAWQSILDNFVAKHPSGVNRVNYAELKKSPAVLDGYINSLLAIDPRTYNQAEQFAYWVNLYNAATVQLVRDNYPVKSITKIKSGVFSFGPWDKKWLTVAGSILSLNDIEHGILRPIWNDNRIHYAVNCASIGCPNLSKTAFIANNTEQLLEQAARDYINHPRGVSIKDGKLHVSSIYYWYLVDFGDSSDSLVQHLQKYANPELKQQLLALNNSSFTHDYDWGLNR